MDILELKISELEQFADIMAIQNEDWMPRFKKWFHLTIRQYCRGNCIVIASHTDEQANLCTLPIDELSEALYLAYYTETLQLIRYDEEKLDWWESSIDNYESSKAAYFRFVNKGVCYILKKFKKFMTIAKRFNKRNISLSMVDITEIALARYVSEKRGDVKSFIEFLR